MRSGKNIVDTIVYTAEQGAGGNGNSLQKVRDVWAPLPPTPGAYHEDQIVILKFEDGRTATGKIVASVPARTSPSQLRLESSFSLESWTTIPAVITIADNRCIVTFQNSLVPARFFRLVAP